MTYLIIFQLACLMTWLIWPWKPLKVIGLAVLAILGG